MSGMITTDPFCPVSGKTTPVVLVVSPSLNIDGRKAYSTRGQLFDGKVDGRVVVKRSTTPFCDAARVLLAEGVRPEAKLVMRHANSPYDALRSTVGAAAGLTVADDTGGKPIFTKWSPYDARSRSLDAPPMHEMASRCPTRQNSLQRPSHDAIFPSRLASGLRRPGRPLCRERNLKDAGGVSAPQHLRVQRSEARSGTGDLVLVRW
jgi:hypothetical protein